MLQLTKKPSFQQGLPEPAEAKEAATQTLPWADWIPAIPAGMTTWLKHLANQDERVLVVDLPS